ncbi:MAG: hypothetical protein IIB95_08050 [Candidatus Marinimicrobia bacterium]|nr:hypothetical protein [Candidatus Neomarinimicrobiota bacterium]
MISIWLTPAEKDAKYLQNIINNLAAEYHAPIFSPHCTLYSPTDLGKIELERILKDAATGVGPISVTKDKLNHTPIIWKTVFIDLKPSWELSELSHRIKFALQNSNPNPNLNPIPYSFSPHISLIYKEMPDEQKEKIIRNLSVKNSYKMDKITAMKTGHDVKHWEKIAEVQLNA